MATFSFVLEALTHAYAHDAAALKQLLSLTTGSEHTLNIVGRGPAYGTKLAIVRQAIEGIQRALADRFVPSGAFHKLLQANINIMTLIDEPENNDAALVLSARAAFAADGHVASAARLRDNTVEMSYLADTRDWVDLYNSWNLVLGLKTKVSPFFAAKLLIPSVGDYAANPEAYMHERAVALYLFMLWRMGPNELSDGSTLNWRLPALAAKMSVQNAVSAAAIDERARTSGYGRGDTQPLVARFVHWYDTYGLRRIPQAIGKLR